ncbi:MAG: hypothetical protein JW894_02505 [Bacteroidales bacterium]|nr:hypothetical protein [Bacteroidales bacterium]
MIILENTHSAMTHFTAIASEMGIKTVVIPHNLESLVPRQVSRLTNKIAPFWLDEDIFLMKYASEIFTISREEQWLLKLFSIDAKYLPYKSTSNYDEYLTQIKKKREKSLKEHFLIMGSAGNTPTFQGMVKLIEYLNKLSNSKLKIYLIGFGTSSVQKMIHKKSGIINLGEITNDQLSDLLQKSKAVIINQNCSSGALTKIPELIRASVPIIINSGAARNFYNLKGLYIYNSLKELGKIIESFDTINESNGNSVYNEELIFEYCSACVNS